MIKWAWEDDDDDDDMVSILQNDLYVICTSVSQRIVRVQHHDYEKSHTSHI